MQIKLGLFMVMAAALLLILPGCASAPAGPPSSQAQAGIFVEQVPVTSYMLSQVGTPNELSPLAPAEGRNVRKVGNRWFCDLGGRPHVFNSATSRWEPQ
jgi:hypothetical protein